MLKVSPIRRNGESVGQLCQSAPRDTAFFPGPSLLNRRGNYAHAQEASPIGRCHSLALRHDHAVISSVCLLGGKVKAQLSALYCQGWQSDADWMLVVCHGQDAVHR